MNIRDFNYLHDIKDEIESLENSTESMDYVESNIKEIKNKAYNFIKSKEAEIKNYLETTIISLESDAEINSIEFYYLGEINNLRREFIPAEMDEAINNLNKTLVKSYRANKSIYRIASEYTDLTGCKTLGEKAGLISNNIYSKLNQYTSIKSSIEKLISFKYDTDIYIIHRTIFLKIQNGDLANLITKQAEPRKKPKSIMRRSLQELFISTELYNDIITFLEDEEMINRTKENYTWTGPRNDNQFKPKTSLIHFGVYLLKNGYLAPGIKDIELKNALNKLFNLNYKAQNFSKTKREVFAGSNGIDQEYQELFFSLPKPI